MKSKVFFIGDHQHLQKHLNPHAGEHFEFMFFSNIDDMAFFDIKEHPVIIMIDCGNHPNRAEGKTSLLCDRVTQKIKNRFPGAYVVFFGELAAMGGCSCAKQSNHIDLFFEKTDDPLEIYNFLRRVSLAH